MSHGAIRRLMAVLVAASIGGVEIYRHGRSIEDAIYANPAIQYWLLVFAGNWPGSPPQIPGEGGKSIQIIGKNGYALSAVIALCLGIGNLSAVLALLFKLPRLLQLKEATMKLSQITSARDVAIKLALIEALPPDLVDQLYPLIDTAFEKGDHSWRRNTAIIHGQDALDEITKISETTTFNTRHSATHS